MWVLLLGSMSDVWQWEEGACYWRKEVVAVQLYQEERGHKAPGCSADEKSAARTNLWPSVTAASSVTAATGLSFPHGTAQPHQALLLQPLTEQVPRQVCDAMITRDWWMLMNDVSAISKQWKTSCRKRMWFLSITIPRDKTIFFFWLLRYGTPVVWQSFVLQAQWVNTM